MPTENEIQEYEKLIQLVRDALARDTDLRIQYEVGDRFKFVRDRLQGVLTHLEEQIKLLEKANEQVPQVSEVDDKMLVYVYLYNAQGILLKSWATMFTPKVFYEYSVNRPIYRDKKEIEMLLRSKTNQQQHAYLTIKVNQNDIISTANDLKDKLGNALVRVKEGSLRFENRVVFTHNGHDYEVTAQGELLKKP